MKRRINHSSHLMVLTITLMGITGCKSIGPGTVARDRFEYSSSIGDSWKRQTLLNIVKLRYLDPPIFVDVGQIVAGYSLETGITAGGSLPETSAGGGNVASFGGSAKYTDRPTVTYVPLTGNKFVKSLMTPLPTEAVFFMIQSGWPADAVLGAAVATINGLKNEEASIGGVAKPDPDFLRVQELLRKIQVSGGVAMRVEQDAQKRQTTILALRTKNISQETIDQIAELRRLLRLNPEITEFKLVFGATSTNERELAVVTRSLMHIMTMMSVQVGVPPEDIAQGRATPGVEGAILKIGCSKKRPADAFVAVAYRNRWFWIDDRDLKTKRSFAFIMLLFTLADTGEKEPLPLITIPAQ